MYKSWFCIVDMSSAEGDQRDSKSADLAIAGPPPAHVLGAAPAVDEDAALSVDEDVRDGRVDQMLAQWIERSIVGKLALRRRSRRRRGFRTRGPTRLSARYDDEC